ncbi:MAG TPA: hypothetical protein VJ824_05005 [Bacillota bacterium]|nr:hypothetical protein [Bacillota bacterium]
MAITQEHVEGKDLVQKWVQQSRSHGKTDDQIIGTVFVYGDEMLTLEKAENGELVIESKKTPVVIFRKLNELHKSNVCRACGTEYHSHKEAIQCCASEDE